MLDIEKEKREFELEKAHEIDSSHSASDFPYCQLQLLLLCNLSDGKNLIVKFLIPSSLSLLCSKYH